MSELFSSILIPGFFLLACILQLHYFHQPFMQLTDLEHIPLPGASRLRCTHRCGPTSSATASEEQELGSQLMGAGAGGVGVYRVLTPLEQRRALFGRGKEAGGIQMGGPRTA